MKKCIFAAVCAIALPLFAAPHTAPHTTPHVAPTPGPKPVPHQHVAPHHEMRHGRKLPMNAVWCKKCDGYGYHRTWYGMKKTCGICDGRGWCLRPVPPPPPPPPKKVVPPPPPRKVVPPPPRPAPVQPAPVQHGPNHKGGPRR